MATHVTITPASYIKPMPICIHFRSFAFSLSNSSCVSAPWSKSFFSLSISAYLSCRVVDCVSRSLLATRAKTISILGKLPKMYGGREISSPSQQWTCLAAEQTLRLVVLRPCEWTELTRSPSMHGDRFDGYPSPDNYGSSAPAVHRKLTCFRNIFVSETKLRTRS